MAEPLTPRQMIDTLKKWNVDYELYPGWKTRQSGGDSNPIGFIIHHTGGGFTESENYLDFLFNRGRPGIPGPLCNFSIGPSGKVYVGSLENANHAGMGDWTTRQLVGSESYSGYSEEIDPGPDDYGTGNELFWGVEINYPGVVKMKAAQYNSAVRLSAALMDAFGQVSGIEWTALSVIGHREHSRRKWDPGQEEMDEFRRDVRDLLKAGPRGGDDVSYNEVWRTDDVMRAPEGMATEENKRWWPESIMENVGDYAVGRMRFQSPYLREKVRHGKPAKTRWLEEWTWHYSKGARSHAAAAEAAAKSNTKQIATLSAQVTGLANAVAQLASGTPGGLDLAAIRAEAQAGAEEALRDVEVTVTFDGEPDDDSDQEPPAAPGPGAGGTGADTESTEGDTHG